MKIHTVDQYGKTQVLDADVNFLLETASMFKPKTLSKQEPTYSICVARLGGHPPSSVVFVYTIEPDGTIGCTAY